MRCVWLLGVMLAGCTVTPKDNSPQAQCARDAYNDPRVKELYAQTPDGMYTQQSEERRKMDEALRQATIRCLQAKGLAIPGGVEPVVYR